CSPPTMPSSAKDGMLGRLRGALKIAGKRPTPPPKSTRRQPAASPNPIPTPGPDAEFFISSTESSCSDSEDAAEGSAARRGPPGLLQRIGVPQVILVVVSILLLIGAIAFLTWVWFGNGEIQGWRELILGPNNALSITLTSVAIRFSIASL